MRKKVFALIVGCILAMSFALVGCGGGSSSGSSDAASTEAAAPADPAENFIGTWEISGMDDGETVYTDADIQQLKDFGMNVQLVLNEDGTAAMDVFGEVMDGGTWEATSETEGSLTFDGQSIPLTLNDGVLALSQDGQTMSFAYVGAPVALAAATAAPASTTSTAPVAVSSSTGLAGTWNLYEITGNDDSAASPEDVQMAADMGMTVTMTLNEDGTGSFDMFGEVMEVTWEEAAGGYTIYLEGSPAPMTLGSDGMLTIDAGDGGAMVFQKADASASGLAA